MRRGSGSKNGSGTAADGTAHVTAGTGNVFADLGLPQPELALVKAELVRPIRALIAAKNLTQVKAAERLGLDQPKVSALTRGREAGYTIDRLFRFLTVLGQRVAITVRPAPNGAVNAGRMVVVD
jgi:predicted XRE-type DNA-binding protein